VAVSEKGDSSGPLVVERRGDALLIGFNRPEKRNAIDLATTEAVHQVLTDYARERCILVLHSTTPGMFVAGADIAELVKRDADDAFMGINVRLFERLEAHRWPTIAVVDGPALGGGCELAMACDLRVASTRARFAQPELNLGILAGAGGNWRLPQLVGMAQARRMLYLGETLDADAALAAGLVDAVHEPEAVLDAALDMVATIASRSWRALELTKLALRLHRPATSTFDVAAQSLLFESDDKRERMEKFLNRRKG
jgi:enoyl-CoA hydratase